MLKRPLYAVRAIHDRSIPYYEVYKIGFEDEDGLEKWDYRTESQRAKAAAAARARCRELNRT
jgi:hypothetical protein